MLLTSNNSLMPAISLQDFSINLNNNTLNKSIINKLDLQILQGEIIGIIGSSGEGKTSLMMALLGLLPDEFEVSAGCTEIFGQNIAIECQGDERIFLPVRGRMIGYIFQEPKAVFSPIHTIAQSFERVFKSAAQLPKRSWRAEMLRLLSLVKLPHPEQFLDRYPHEISGGEARRISIAHVLALRPKIIIADEPTGALDAELKDEILELLTEICHAANTALILVSHDLPSLIKHCDRMLVLNDGDHFFGDTQVAIRHPIAQPLIKSDFGSPIFYHNFDENVLTIKNVKLRYHKFWSSQAKTISVPDFSIKKGQIVGLMGRSGIGKSSLARAITVIDPRLKVDGEILIDGINPYKLRGQALRIHRRSTQIVMQEVRASFNPYLTIQESLLEAVQEADEETQAKIHELMAMCELSKAVLGRLPDQLSGGECQRLCLVRALLARPSLLILDEPTAMLDRINTARFLALIRKINLQKATAILLIGHDQEVMDAICHQIIRFDS